MRCNLANISWDLHDFESLSLVFTNTINTNSKVFVNYVNLHTLYLYNSNTIVKKQIDESLLHIDGMPIIWLLKIKGASINTSYRITWIEILPRLLQYSIRNNLGIFYLGGKSSTIELGLQRLRQLIPGVVISGHDGYFNKDPNSEESSNVIKLINESKAKIVIVGMGMGIQEEWILANKNRINANVIMTSGAALEYFAGEVYTPPRWSGRIGFEWLFRLIDNPRRFWKRYLLEPFLLLKIMLLK